MVCSLSEAPRESKHGSAPVRLALFGAYTCPTTRSTWSIVEEVEAALAPRVDVRFGHYWTAVDHAAALRVAEAAEAACGQDAFGCMHQWLMAHPECHDGDRSRWAEEAGLDVARFRADLRDRATTGIWAHRIAARALGVARSPSLWVSGAQYTGVPELGSLLRVCEQAVDAVDAAARPPARDTREEWLALAAHELRSPMSVLCTLTKLMVDEASGSDGRSEAHLLVVRRVVQRTWRLIEQMTTAAALSGDYTRPPLCESGELGALARQVVEALSYEERPHANVVVHAGAPIYGVWPTAWVEQIVANLVGNALKFGGPGQVDVEVAGDPSGVSVVVRDHGPGLAEEDWPRLVRAFERGSDVGGIPGLGLGLHVVNSLLGAMGGRLTVDSSPGQGASFRAAWPRTARL